MAGQSVGPGEQLRRWRARRGLSQLHVAVECAVSTRHLSFVETGRARPSKQLVVHLARFLEASNREVNTCLLAAGHAPLHLVDLDTEWAALDATLDEMIDRHHPYPAFVFNADWVMERLNVGGQWLCSVLMPDIWVTVDDPRAGVDMIATLVHEDGLLSRMRDAPRVGAAMLRQLRVEQLTNPRLAERVDRLERSLAERYPEHRPDDEQGLAEASFHLDFETTYGPLSFFTLQGVVGIPQDITVATPRVELWFPADLRTRTVLDRHAGLLDADLLEGRSA
jgi:transcriptional regulator with XRE-family HTH domain